MSTFLKKYTNAMLVGLTVLFLVLIIGSFVWGIGYLVTELNPPATGSQTGNAVQGYDLAGAASLDYRGIPVPSVATTTSQ